MRVLELIIFIIAAFGLIVLLGSLGKKKRHASPVKRGSGEKEDKLKRLENLAAQMQDEFVEKAKQGDDKALARAGEMALLKYMAEKSRTCQHTYEWKTVDGKRERICTKCGLEDLDSRSIEEKWADAWS